MCVINKLGVKSAVSVSHFRRQSSFVNLGYGAIGLGSATPPPQSQGTKQLWHQSFINVYTRIILTNITVQLLVQKWLLPCLKSFPNLFLGGDSCFPFISTKTQIQQMIQACKLNERCARPYRFLNNNSLAKSITMLIHPPNFRQPCANCLDSSRTALLMRLFPSSVIYLKGAKNLRFLGITRGKACSIRSMPWCIAFVNAQSGLNAAEVAIIFLLGDRLSLIRLV